MSKITKFITYSILFIFILSAFLVLILTKFGIETKRFNSLITNQVKKYNENLNIDINKVRVYLSIGSLKNPKLRISTKNPVLIYNNKEIDLKAVDTKIDILSYFKDNFILEEFEIWTKENKIKDLIAFAALEKPSLIIYNIFISKGDASVYGLINFNKDGKINNYKLNGEIKAAKLNFNKKFNFENINFSFKNYGKKTLITNTKFSFNKITFLSDEIIIPSFKEKINVYGDIRSKKTNINFNNLKIYFNNELNFIKNNEIIFETKNKFSFTIQKGKIKNLKYFSEIFLEKLILGFENNKFKNYFVNYKDSISLENNIIKIDYKNKNFSIDGESDYSFYNSTDQILYKIKKIKNNYDFSTSINFDKKNLKIKPIQYSKKKNKKSNLKLKGTYSKNKIKFSEILYKEGQNYFEINDLILNSNFKINSLKKLKVNYLNDNNKKNEFEIKKDSNIYNLSGKSFDSYKLINNILFSNDDKTFFDNFNLTKQIKLNIYLNKVFLNKEHFSNNLSGEINIKNNKVHNLYLKSFFKNNKKFNLDIKTLKNKQKITSFYSDNAEPFVKHYDFIKGFKEGKIDFYSVKKNQESNSTLNIFDFKVKEMPALTKLLSLASLQGIADIMTGEGIRFNEFEMKFNNTNKLMTIDEIYAIGPAISILMSGYLESNKLLSLRGTLVPATTLNKAIGSLPFIGDILVGKKTGEGVFGVSFKIKGPPKKLKTTVNPIKTLTPRFITRTLEKAKKKD